MTDSDGKKKKKSGAAYRKARKEQHQVEAANQVRRAVVPTATTEDRHAPPAAHARLPLQYSEVPTPDLEDTSSMVRYANQVLAVVMDQTMLDRTITEEQRRRELRDGAAKLGMIRDKAAEQSRIERVEKALGLRTKKAAAGVKTLAGVEKPTTARQTHRGD